MNTENKDYEVGYKKPPVASRFKEGECPNPLGRGGKKKKKIQEFDPGQILQLIDNEAIMVNIEGERKRMLKAEIHFRQLFTKAIKGSLLDARLIAKMAAQYFGPEAKGPSEIFVVVLDKKRLRIGIRSFNGKFHGAISWISTRFVSLIRRILTLRAFARARATGIMLSSRSRSAAINDALSPLASFA
jgi:hypothetical protein